MRRPGRSDEPRAEIFFDEFPKGLEFGLREGVNGPPRRGSAFLQVNLQIIRTVRGKVIGLSFTENVSKFMILWRDVGKIHSLLRQVCLASGNGVGDIGELDAETL